MTNSRLHSVRRWTAVASWEPCEPTCNRRSSLQSTRRCKGQQPCLPAGHMTRHATDPAGRRTPRAVLREHDDERADPRISGGDYCCVRLMACFSPDRCACCSQFNQYRHTLSVFLSGVRAADSGIAGVGGHGGAGGAVEVAVVGLCCVAPSPAQPVPLTPALWSDSPETSASLIGSQSRVNQRSVSAGSISRNRCSSHHFRPPGMEPPARAATCVCCPSFPCAAAIALLLTSAPLHAGRCCTRCWNPALVARQMPSHHRQRRKARHKASVQTGPQPCAQMLARQVGDSTQRRFASPPNHSRGPRAGSAGGAHIGRPRTLHVCATPQRGREQRVCVLARLAALGHC